MSTDPELLSTDAELRQRVARLEQQLDDVLDELRRARATTPETTTGASPRAGTPPNATEDVVGRRHLLQAAGAAAAGAVAATATGVVGAPPADAAAGSFDGNPAVAAKGVGGPGVAAVTDTGSGTAAVEATNDASAGIAVLGLAGATDGTGVEGRGAPGVRATGTGGPGLVATTDSPAPLATAIDAVAPTDTVGIGVSGSGAVGVRGRGTTGVSGISTVGPGLGGTAVDGQGGNGYGVGASSYATYAVFATSTANHSVYAVSSGTNGTGGYAAGVVGRNDNSAQVGVWGQAKQGTGVLANGRVGVSAIGTAVALLAYAPEGAQAQVRLERPASFAPPPARADSHSTGELYFDDGDDLWLCTATGTPGTWRKVSGPATAGALHVLPTPVRVYDSRPGNPPDDVVKGPLANATSRTIDATHNSSGVPTGATAVLANVTVVNTSANGFLALYRNGIAYPGTSTVNWSTTGAVVANLAVTALDTLARLAAYVPAGSSCDFLLDVIGYWR